MLTRERKLELMDLSMETVEPDALTEEEYAFIERPWSETSPEDRALWHGYFSAMPGALEHAVAQCTPQELTITSEALRKISDFAQSEAESMGIEPEFMEELLSLLEIVSCAARNAQQPPWEP